MTAFIVKRIKVEIRGRILMSTIVVVQANVVKKSNLYSICVKIKKKAKQKTEKLLRPHSKFRYGFTVE